jgi:hypothetical protein
MRFCEHLPQLAARAGNMSLINSVTFPNNDHPFRIYQTLTGRESRVPLGAKTVVPPSRSDDPHMGGASGPSSESATTRTIPNSRRVTMASDWATSAAERIIASRTLADSDESLIKAASSLWELIMVLGIH